MSRAGSEDAVEPTRSARIARFMAGYFARYLRRHMNALRLARWGQPQAAGHPGPVVVYSNHPAWWDALVVILLGETLFPERAHFAPFDARTLARYRIFEKLGAFPVDLDSRRGAVQFLHAARAVLRTPDRVLWITAQGMFRDVRARPLGLRPGVAHLAEIAPDALFLPLALDYAFWDERGAEACCAFGPPLAASELAALPRPERLARLETALTETLDRLSADVIAREASAFVPLIAGDSGVGGVYDLWLRLGALFRGRRFDPAHRAAMREGHWAGPMIPVRRPHGGPASEAVDPTQRLHPEVPFASAKGLEGALQKPLRSLEGSFEAACAAPQDEGPDGKTA